MELNTTCNLSKCLSRERNNNDDHFTCYLACHCKTAELFSTKVYKNKITHKIEKI